MYLIYCLVLLLLVYLAPACALNPALLLSSRTAVAIPFVSIATVVVIQKALELTDRYSHELVLLVSLALLVIAVIRVFLLLRSLRPASGMDAGEQRFDWPATHRVLLVLSCLFGLYWAAQLGTSGFDTDDEIYSWNLWAVQHYLGHDIDFYYTQSPYPQLFPILISWCYKFLFQQTRCISFQQSIHCPVGGGSLCHPGFYDRNRFGTPGFMAHPDQRMATAYT